MSNAAWSNDLDGDPCSSPLEYLLADSSRWLALAAWVRVGGRFLSSLVHIHTSTVVPSRERSLLCLKGGEMRHDKPAIKSSPEASLFSGVDLAQWTILITTSVA